MRIATILFFVLFLILIANVEVESARNVATNYAISFPVASPKMDLPSHAISFPVASPKMDLPSHAISFPVASPKMDIPSFSSTDPPSLKSEPVGGWGSRVCCNDRVSFCCEY
ncbi:hypothetical protein ACFE04_022182 [Oxalis oulophora]